MSKPKQAYYPPYDYTTINTVQSMQSPSTVHTRNNALFIYFFHRLLMRSYNTYKFVLPSWWDVNYTLSCLFVLGHMAVLNTSRYGVINLNCGLYGRDIYYQPTHAVISNPLLTSAELRIGRDCEIIKLQPDYTGLYSTLSYYADLMAVTAESLILNVLQARVSTVFTANNKGAVDAYKTVMDDIISGNMATILNKNAVDEYGKLTYEMFNAQVKNNLVADILQDVMRRYEHDFDRAVGIPSSNETKKQRMTIDEVNTSNVETAAEAEVRLWTLQECFARVRAMFKWDTNTLNVTWRHSPLESRKPVQTERVVTE